MNRLAAEIEQHLDTAVTRLHPLHGGSVGEVYAANLANGRQVVVKVDKTPHPTLDIEGSMLRYLADHSQLPLPEVIHSTPELLIMSHLPGESRFSPAAERHAAALLAELHAITAPTFGLEQDTLIGGLHQPNTPSESWIDFFREQRLLHQARSAQRAGRLPASVLTRLERLASQLERWLVEPEAPALIHGDVWTTNVLADGDTISGFLDPAIYFAHPEMELAFITLFNTFGRPFFEQYAAQRPIPPGFFETRRHIYNLFPLLVHVELFGGGYVNQVERILDQFGIA